MIRAPVCPALLYLVPGVVGSQLIRALLHGEIASLWSGAPLPQPPANASGLSCDGCRRIMLLEEAIYCDARKNVDYCLACHAALPDATRASLEPMPVYRRCGVDPPTRDGTSPSGVLL